MDLVILVQGKFVRLSPSNREMMRSIPRLSSVPDAEGLVVKVSYKDGYYVLDGNGTEMRDVTVAWRNRGGGVGGPSWGV